MARFTTALIAEVAPKSKTKEPSQRAQVQQQYRDALYDAVVAKGEALVVVLEEEDKLLTIRNRIKRAATDLNLQDVAIRRRKDRIVAYRGAGDGESGEESPGEAVLEQEGVAS